MKKCNDRELSPQSLLVITFCSKKKNIMQVKREQILGVYSRGIQKHKLK